MKTIKTLTSGDKSARIMKTADGEYIVRFFAGDQYKQDADYFTDDKQDAFDTADVELSREWGKVEETKEITLTIVTVVAVEDDFIEDVLVTATQGGSNYWGDFAGKRGDLTLLTVTDAEGEEDYEHLLNFAKVREAIRKLAVLTVDLDVNAQDRLTIREAVIQQDAGMIDADLADVIVQIACFDKLIYG